MARRVAIAVVVAVALSVCPYITASAQPLSDPPEFGGGGEFEHPEHVPHLTEVERSNIKRRLGVNIENLRREGKLGSVVRGLSPSFNWPVRAAAHVNDYGVDAITNYVDQNPAAPLLDYYCGARTYNGHQGLDVITWPFPWIKMDNDEVEVIAAAPGQIVSKDDGNFDRNCSFNSGSWNAVYVEHGDGSTAWYGHLKNGSLTAKNVGDSVALGEHLGVVGSSGNSTVAHLHLEVYDDQWNLIDPYQGTCNSLNATSWWANQPGYYEPQVN